jgi:hypothetical protein
MVFAIERTTAKVAAHPVAQVLRLADIEQPALGIEHAVDAGAGRQLCQLGIDEGRDHHRLQIVHRRSWR